MGTLGGAAGSAATVNQSGARMRARGDFGKGAPTQLLELAECRKPWLHFGALSR